MESFVVTNFKIRGSFPFLRILYGNMISAHGLFHNVSSDILTGNLPYFFLDHFVCVCVCVCMFVCMCVCMYV